jgi:biotin carboxylase
VLLLAHDKNKSSGSGTTALPCVIVKPYRGVASESVALCSTVPQMEQAWEQITSSSVFGTHSKHDSVLVQEYLQGIQHAVDVVSRNGEHNVAAIWWYDKRPANGAASCYYQAKLVDVESGDPVLVICEYVKKALSALGVQWGHQSQ